MRDVICCIVGGGRDGRSLRPDCRAGRYCSAGYQSNIHARIQSAGRNPTHQRVPAAGLCRLSHVAAAGAVYARRWHWRGFSARHGLVQVLTGNGIMRPFILAGIKNTQRRRDLTGPTTSAEDREIAPKVGGPAAFRQFIREELMPQVKQRCRTIPETAIVGESLAGPFVVETLLLEPKPFNTCLAFGPSLWLNNGQLAAQAGSVLHVAGRPPVILHLATSSQGALKAARQLVGAVGPEASRTGIWHYEPIPPETQATIYHPAALRAFRLVFKPRVTGIR